MVKTVRLLSVALPAARCGHAGDDAGAGVPQQSLCSVLRRACPIGAAVTSATGHGTAFRRHADYWRAGCGGAAAASLRARVLDVAPTFSGGRRRAARRPAVRSRRRGGGATVRACGAAGATGAGAQVARGAAGGAASAAASAVRTAAQEAARLVRRPSRPASGVGVL